MIDDVAFIVNAQERKLAWRASFWPDTASLMAVRERGVFQRRWMRPQRPAHTNAETDRLLDKLLDIPSHNITAASHSPQPTLIDRSTKGTHGATGSQGRRPAVGQREVHLRAPRRAVGSSRGSLRTVLGTNEMTLQAG